MLEQTKTRLRPITASIFTAFPVRPRESSVIDMIKAFGPMDQLIADLYAGEVAYIDRCGSIPVMLDYDGTYGEIVPSLNGWTSCMERIARRLRIPLDLSLIRRLAARLEAGMLLDLDDVDRMVILVERCRAVYFASPVFVRQAATVDELIDIEIEGLGLRRAA